MRTSSNRLAWALLALVLFGAGVVAAQTRVFRIHPSIGIARVGDSAEYYLAPDAWDREFVPSDGTARSYRDGDGAIQRMGVRFRVYEYVLDRAGRARVQREINNSDNVSITWRVQLVNKKAAKDGLNQEAPATLTIDTGVQSIGPQKEQRQVGGFIGPARTPVELGELITESTGRLTVLGGRGVAASWRGGDERLPREDVLDNPGWFDDTSDGPVRATIRFTAGDRVREFEARSAWVVVAPPDYAHPVMNLVTLYDLVADRSTPESDEKDEEPDPVSFISDVYPILRRVPHMQWTTMSQLATRYGRTAMHAHGIEGTGPSLRRLLQGAHEMHRTRADFFEPGVFALLHLKDLGDPRFWEAQRLRNHIVDRLKDPRPGGATSGGIGEPHSMPPVENLTLTPTQYDIFIRWRDGYFHDDWDDPDDQQPAWNPVDPPREFEPRFSEIGLADQPRALDRAAMDGAVGGPLDPGIEVGPLVAERTTYDEPFHVSDDVQAGDLTQGLSVPWQAGFNMQPELYPGARPVYLIVMTGRGYEPALWTRPYNADPQQFGETVYPPDATEMDRLMDYNKIYGNQRMRSNESMVDHWMELGFLARDTTNAELMYVETDRVPPPNSP